MTNHELKTKLGQLILAERKMTNKILNLINIALNRRSYLELGYSSMFDWLVNGFGYSSSAAFRRIEAAKLLNAVPDAAQKLESGKINLTTLSRAQTVMRQQERISGDKLTVEKKADVIKAIQNQSSQEAERTLIFHFPEVATYAQPEKQKVLNEHQVRHQMNLSTEASANLKRAKEVLSHIIPQAQDGDIVAYALEYLLRNKDPLRGTSKNRGSRSKGEVEKTSRSLTPGPQSQESSNKNQDRHFTAAAAVKSRIRNQAELRRRIFLNGRGACSFKDPHTGNVCGSSFQVEVDHIRPKALSGDDSYENLRLLCRQHNLLVAERCLGKEKMLQYWRKRE